MRIRLFILCFFLMPHLIFAQDVDLIKEKIESHFLDLDYIDCRYRQERQLSMIKDPLISTGRFKYEKGGTISLEQLTPFEETFFLNESTNNKLDKYISNFIISIVSGEILKNNKLDIQFLEDENNYIVSMSPNSGIMQKQLKHITLIFNQLTIELIELEMIAKNKDITTINFYSD